MDKKIAKKISSLGIGATSYCNLNCPHCYSRKLIQKSLSIKEFIKIIRDFPNLKKVNFGTGESIFNKNFLNIVDYLLSEKVEIAITSNGFTINQLSECYLKKIKDVDISLDFPIADIHDRWRGQKGTYFSAVKAIERCKKAGVTVSIAMALMNINYKYLEGFKILIDKYNIPLRINLYKPVDTDKYLMSYTQFWKSIEILSKNFKLISCSEPILSLVTENEVDGSPCGKSARLHSNGQITQCVYLGGKNINFEEFNLMKNEIPNECQNCKVVDKCKGGCLSRRLLTYGSSRPDQYCPILKNQRIPQIKFIRGKKRNFIHSKYLCTLIVE